MPRLPLPFLERLQAILPAGSYESVLQSFSSPPSVSVRINTLKIQRPDVVQALQHEGSAFTPVPWSDSALILGGDEAGGWQNSDLTKSGRIYRQGLSSMLPALALSPQPGERILDMCAAPGSKTTQIAALMQNHGEIVAIEAIRPRFYKLKSVVEQMGAQCVSFKVMDARKFRSNEPFDKILLDVPCSSEGRFRTNDPKSFAYWSLRKIKEMVRKQRGLILNASRLLKPGGVLVYSTCTFAPEENEGVIDWALKKTKGAIETAPVHCEGIKTYPALTEWQGKAFNPGVGNCFRVLPDGVMEGFFIAKLIFRGRELWL